MFNTVVENGIRKQIREFSIMESEITCTNCCRCYSAIASNEKIFCQVHSMRVDPNNTEYNHEFAKKCSQWTPGFTNIMIPHYDDDRWYEKDSIA